MFCRDLSFSYTLNITKNYIKVNNFTILLLNKSIKTPKNIDFFPIIYSNGKFHAQNPHKNHLRNQYCPPK